MAVALHAAEQPREVLAADLEVARQLADAHAGLRLRARQGAEDRPLLRRQAFVLDRAAAGLMREGVAALKEKRKPDFRRFAK